MRVFRPPTCGHRWRAFSYQDVAVQYELERELGAVTFCTVTGNLIALDPESEAPMWTNIEFVPSMELSLDEKGRPW